MLGTFPNAFSQCSAISQAAISQALAAALGPQPVLAAALGPLTHPNCSARPHFSVQRLRGPNLTFGKLLLGKLHVLEVSTWEIDTWEVALGKMPLG